MLFFFVIERSVLMALVLYNEGMLKKVTTQRTQQFFRIFPNRKWLFLPKQKLELMFSSIEPSIPRHIFPATSFPLFVPQTHTRQPMKRWLARVLRLSANQLRAVFPCLRSRSQLIFTCNSVKLLDSSVYFPTHPPRSSHISTVATLL